MFSIDEKMTVSLTNINKRKEVHGAELKHAMDLSLAIDGPNTILLKFPGLLEALYEPNSTEDIPGVAPVRPNLRTAHWIKGPHKINYEGTGFLLTLIDGPVSGKQLELADVDLNEFKWEAKGGNGTGRLAFRAQLHAGLDQQTMGRINTMDGKQLEMLAAPPDLQSGSQPERLTKAQQKAKNKAEAEAAFTSPFKFSTGADGKTKDNNPPVDPNAPDAGTVFAAAVAAGKTVPAKKVVPIKKKPTPKTAGRGSK